MSAGIIAAGSVAGALVALGAAWRLTAGGRRTIAGFFHRMQRLFDVVLGTPEIPDPDRPGHPLRVAVPDMGVRMSRVERRLAERSQTLAEARDAAAAAECAANAAKASAKSATAAAASVAQEMTALARRVTTLEAVVNPQQVQLPALAQEG
jgi:hypothetical protein